MSLAIRILNGLGMSDTLEDRLAGLKARIAASKESAQLGISSLKASALQSPDVSQQHFSPVTGQYVDSYELSSGNESRERINKVIGALRKLSDAPDTALAMADQSLPPTGIPAVKDPTTRTV